ncbi:MAG: hypothetical protein QXL94_02735 [Candidatus Parvarchaeum sp.]
MTTRISIKDYISKCLESNEIEWDFIIKPDKSDKLNGILTSNISFLHLGDLTVKYNYEISTTNDGDVEVAVTVIKNILKIDLGLRVVYNLNEKLQTEDVLMRLLDNDEFHDRFIKINDSLADYVLMKMVKSIVRSDDSNDWKLYKSPYVLEDTNFTELPICDKKMSKINNIFSRLGFFK